MTEAIAEIADDAAAKRRRPFIEAATKAFFENGFGDTTMSSIAFKVGGSKTTLWSYFPSKEALFAAVVDDIIERHSDAFSVELPEGEDVALVLKRLGTALLATLLSEPLLNLHRIIVGESRRFPHLAELYYERGPRRGQARLANFLAGLMDTGALRRGDPLTAAQQFVALCQAGGYQFAVMNVRSPHRKEQAAADVKLAVETFCRGWART